jgi:hypothetical protein
VQREHQSGSQIKYSLVITKTKRKGGKGRNSKSKENRTSKNLCVKDMNRGLLSQHGGLLRKNEIHPLGFLHNVITDIRSNEAIRRTYNIEKKLLPFSSLPILSNLAC